MGIFTPNVDKLMDNRDYPALVKLLSHRKSDVRLNAFFALADNPDGEIAAKCRKLLDDPDPRVRTVATMRFGDLNEKAIIENLKQIVLYSELKNRLRALRLLAGRKLHEHPEISAILQLAIRDKNALVRHETIKTMKYFRDAHSIDSIIDALNDRDPQIRIASARALGEMKAVKALNSLIGSMADNNRNVQSAARDALMSLGVQEGIDAIREAPFVEVVKKMNDTETRRLEAIQEIQTKNLEKGVYLLAKACSDEYKMVRIEAIRAIGSMKALEAKSVVKRLMDDTYYDVRLEVVRTVGNMLEPSDRDFLEVVVASDKHRQVREEASRLLRSLSE